MPEEYNPSREDVVGYVRNMFKGKEDDGMKLCAGREEYSGSDMGEFIIEKITDGSSAGDKMYAVCAMLCKNEKASEQGQTPDITALLKEFHDIFSFSEE